MVLLKLFGLPSSYSESSFPLASGQRGVRPRDVVLPVTPPPLRIVDSFYYVNIYHIWSQTENMLLLVNHFPKPACFRLIRCGRPLDEIKSRSQKILVPVWLCACCNQCWLTLRFLSGVSISGWYPKGSRPLGTRLTCGWIAHAIRVP